MGNLISFMKEVADGLRESGNFGTAHIYRSSLSAILAFHGSDKLPFRKNKKAVARMQQEKKELKKSFSILLTHYMRLISK